VLEDTPKPFQSQAALIDALRDAAELEHQLMVQYLYAGFSLVRAPYGKPDDKPHCTPAQYEAVRRWSSTLFMVARQEMEHLSLANGMLTALRGEPHLARQNITEHGLLSPYFTSAAIAEGDLDARDRIPVPFAYAFTRFDEATMGRFVCGESPPLDQLPPGRDPHWCFFDPVLADKAAEADFAAATEPDIPLGRTHRDLGDIALGDVSTRKEVGAGSVQELYQRIRETFRTLPDLKFDSDPAEVEVPVEYHVFVFPVTDRTSAIEAVDLILEQGEGLEDPWNLDSHFGRFFEMNEELVGMKEVDEDFDPAYPLLDYPDRSKIGDDLTRLVFDATNEAYVTLLFILASLYQNAVPAAKDQYPYLSTALSQNAFAPAMTMILRALVEILVRLPIEDASGKRIGPSFWIPEADLKLLEHPKPKWTRDLSYLMERWDKMTAAIERASTEAGKRVEPEIDQSLHYVYESAYRTGLNIRHTYEEGLYSKFVNIPPEGAKP
jgi:hypothetical protein